ncbi:MAG: hypothetical protein ACRCX2_15540 [Paraclostridium sp.]
MRFEVGDEVIVCQIGSVAKELVGLVGVVKVNRFDGDNEIGVDFGEYLKSEIKGVGSWYSHTLGGTIKKDTGLWFYEYGSKFPIEALEIHKNNVEFNF